MELCSGLENIYSTYNPIINKSKKHLLIKEVKSIPLY